MNKTISDTELDNVLASANGALVSVHGFGTIKISHAEMVKYINTYNTDPISGFSVEGGEVILRHKGQELTLSKQDAKYVCDLTKAADSLGLFTDPSTP